MAHKAPAVAYICANDGQKFKSDLDTLRAFVPIAAYAASLELPYGEALPKDAEPLEFPFSELDSRTVQQLLRWVELRKRKGSTPSFQNCFKQE